MKASVVTRVTIAAKPSEVFTYLIDLRYHYLWNPQLQEITPIIKLKQGAVYKTLSRVLGMTIKASNEVTKFTQNQELELVNKTGLVAYRANFRLLTKAGKTQVICNTTVSSDINAFAFTVPVLSRLARRELQTDMQALKLAVEHKLD
jgi:hypothetical protein